MKTQDFSPLAALAMLFVPSSATAGPLADRIGEKVTEFSATAPETTKQSYAEGIQAVVASGITQSAKQVGDKAPDFTLRNAEGETRRLFEMLKKGPVVLTWYRGGWCPYCNLTLLALQEKLPEFKAAGVQLVALTPELPDKAAVTTAKNKLEFEVLTDLNHEVGREYGIVFKLTPGVRDLYQAKFKLTDFNGLKAGNGELPLAATYIITPDGTIRYAFLHADYRERAEPADLVTFVRQLNRAQPGKP